MWHAASDAILAYGFDQRKTALKTPVSQRLGLTLAVSTLTIIAAIQFASDGIHVQAFIIDTLFVLDVTLRTANGHVPHVDFVLHLGSLPFFLIAAFKSTSNAFVLAQLFFTSLCVAAGYWIALSRLDRASGTLLLLGIVILGTSVSTPLFPEATLALFYNRWAWMLGLLFSIATFTEPRWETSQRVEGRLVGVLAFALLTTKITFFVALVPLALVRFVVLKKWQETIYAFVAFLILFLISVLIFGFEFWAGYYETLVWVSKNSLRPAPGRSLAQVLAGPDFLIFTISYMVFLQCFLHFKGGGGASLWQFALAAGLIYAQYQNYGNAPIWVLYPALLTIVLRRDASARNSMSETRVWGGLAVVFVTLSALTFWPMAQSNFENLKNSQIKDLTSFIPDARFLGRLTAPQAEPIQTMEIKLPRPVPLHVTSCQIESGSLEIIAGVADLLRSIGEPVFVADGPSPYWMAAGVPPLQGAAPWNYGSVKGIKNAKMVIVPKCPLKPKYQMEILRTIELEGLSLIEVRKNKWAIAFRIIPHSKSRR